MHNTDEIVFNRPLTFMVGDNGVGKSTLIQAIAISNQIPQLTNQMYENDPEYENISQLANCLKSHWDVKSKRGFFFRADDFISFVRKNKKLRKELETELALLDEKGIDKLAFERQPFQNSLTVLKRSYPKELDKLSHGQSFLALFKSRLAPNSLYILDEPETPLSPQNQLSLLYMIDEQIKQGSQFIIASHSPILTAYPNADIYHIKHDDISLIEYEEIENVAFMKHFMTDPQRFMHYTFERDN
ncbi:AAA family ATPase [Vagococcus silagei]|uniref:AAA family ATPase n=1 Tax=Vagococcus silagei TaxID=2508885 RepID=UPI00109D2C35|nr:AAA family ATPase [Vagococcus silagei]